MSQECEEKEVEEITEKEAKHRLAVAKTIIAEHQVAEVIGDHGFLEPTIGPRADPRPIWHSRHGWLRAVEQARAQASPLEEVAKLSVLVKDKLRSRAAALAAMGRDIEEVDAENAIDRARATVLGYPLWRLSTMITTPSPGIPRPMGFLASR